MKTKKRKAKRIIDWPDKSRAKTIADDKNEFLDLIAEIVVSIILKETDEEYVRNDKYDAAIEKDSTYSYNQKNSNTDNQLILSDLYLKI